MSMQNWLHDAQSFPNNGNGAFHNGDPSMAFMQNPSTATFDFNHMQNAQQQQQQRMQNGIVRNGSPTYNNTMYQTQPMIPSKRPRPRENSIGASPQQHPGTLAGSRSQTPQAPYPGGFQGAVNGNHPFPGAALYQSVQQPGGHASPSPVVQNQAFNLQGQHQRVQTMSPSPFSPASQNFAHRASPPQSENGSRVNTPQNGGPQYAQGMPYTGAQNQPFTPPMGSQVNGAGLSQYSQHLQAQHQQQQLRMNEIRMRQMQQQRQQAGTGAVNPMSQNPNQMSAHQIAAYRAQQAQFAQQRPNNNSEQLLRTLQHWARQHGQQFNTQPIVAGKPISSVHLFIGVIKMGGSKRVTALGQWPQVATSMQFQAQQQMMAAQELQRYWQTSLALYEHLFGQQRRVPADSQRAANPALRQDASSPQRPMRSQSSQQLMQPPAHIEAPSQKPAKQINQQRSHLRQPLQDGRLTPQQAQAQVRPRNTYRGPQSIQAPVRILVPVTRYRTKRAFGPGNRGSPPPKTDPWPAKTQLGKEFVPVADIQDAATARTWGGLELGPRSPFLAAVEENLKYKLSVPKTEELGVIDIRALMLSLRSGLHAEVRVALDTLASLTKDYAGLRLEDCEDLLETLIDCADNQVQLLADHSAEVSDEMLFNSYEETIRGCKAENATLQEIPEFGTLEYDLDRAADRLICVTTIIRNLSMLHANQVAIANPITIRFMAVVVRYIGTRSMLLRAHRNVLDFSKDILAILANVSQHIDLPGKEEALCILHFLLAFAPSPTPNSNEDEALTFSSYLPGLHRYYPYAIDCLARLLARGDPNRTFYRLIFAADTLSSPPSDLLTRSFGLAIAALPDMGKSNPGSLTKSRLPYLLQGLLAAEILTSLIPSAENELARSWLTSQDGFALKLLRLVTELGQRPQIARQSHQLSRAPDPDPFGHATITDRGFTILWKLTERAKDATGNSKGLPLDVIPNKQSVLAAMKNTALPPNITRQLYALSILDT